MAKPSRCYRAWVDHSASLECCASSDIDASEWKIQKLNAHIHEIDFPAGDVVYATNKVGALLSLRLAPASGSLFREFVSQKGHLRGWLLPSVGRRIVWQH
jgi:hypothetical protein